MFMRAPHRPACLPPPAAHSCLHEAFPELPGAVGNVPCFRVAWRGLVPPSGAPARVLKPWLPGSPGPRPGAACHLLQLEPGSFGLPQGLVSWAQDSFPAATAQPESVPACQPAAPRTSFAPRTRGDLHCAFPQFLHHCKRQQNRIKTPPKERLVPPRGDLGNFCTQNYWRLAAGNLQILVGRVSRFP